MWISLAVSINAHQQSRWIIQVSLESAFSPRLLLRTILVHDTACRCSYLANLVPNLCFLLCLHIFSDHFLKSLLAHEDQLIVCNASWFIGIGQIHIGREDLCWRFSPLRVAVALHIGLRQILGMNCIKYVLLSKFAVHGDLILFIAHFIELFVSELAFAVGPYHHEWFLRAVIMFMLYFLIFALNILKKLFLIFICFLKMKLLLGQRFSEIGLRLWTIGAGMMLLLGSGLLALSVTRRWMRKAVWEAWDALHVHDVGVDAWAESVLLWEIDCIIFIGAICLSAFWGLDVRLIRIFNTLAAQRLSYSFLDFIPLGCFDAIISSILIKAGRRLVKVASVSQGFSTALNMLWSKRVRLIVMNLFLRDRLLVLVCADVAVCIFGASAIVHLSIPRLFSVWDAGFGFTKRWDLSWQNRTSFGGLTFAMWTFSAWGLLFHIKTRHQYTAEVLLEVLEIFLPILIINLACRGLPLQVLVRWFLHLCGAVGVLLVHISALDSGAINAYLLLVDRTILIVDIVRLVQWVVNTSVCLGLRVAADKQISVILHFCRSSFRLFLHFGSISIYTFLSDPTRAIFTIGAALIIYFWPHRGQSTRATLLLVEAGSCIQVRVVASPIVLWLPWTSRSICVDSLGVCDHRLWKLTLSLMNHI